MLINYCAVWRKPVDNRIVFDAVAMRRTECDTSESTCVRAARLIIVVKCVVWRAVVANTVLYAAHVMIIECDNEVVCALCVNAVRTVKWNSIMACPLRSLSRSKQSGAV